MGRKLVLLDICTCNKFVHALLKHSFYDKDDICIYCKVISIISILCIVNHIHNCNQCFTKWTKYYLVSKFRYSKQIHRPILIYHHYILNILKHAPRVVRISVYFFSLWPLIRLLRVRFVLMLVTKDNNKNSC